MRSEQPNDIESLLGEAPDPPQMDRGGREAIWRSLESSLRAEGARGPVEGRTPKSRVRRSWWLLRAAVAAAVLALALILARNVILPGSRAASIPFGKIQIARGRCTATDRKGRERDLDADRSVSIGDTLSVGPAGGARIRLHDQSEIWLCGGTQVECIALRSDPGPTLRLVRGELRADVTADPDQLFAVETPTATLNVLGTQFHCQVFSNPNPVEGPTMSAKQILQRAFMVLTVLSGTVEVSGGNGPRAVHAAQRSIVASNTATVTDVRNPQYAQQWLGEPGSRAGATILYILPLAPSMLYSLWATDDQDHDPHHVTDFVGTAPRVILRVDGDAVLVEAGSLIHAHVGGGICIAGSGRPLIADQVFLVDLKTGQKMLMPYLDDCDPLYPSMSPDRRKLAFVGSRGTGQQRDFGLFVIDIESAEIKKMLDGAIKTCPNWSPDSRWLVVSRAEGYVTNHALVLVDTLTGEVVETGLRGAGAVFAPEGQEIAYVADFAQGGHWYQGVPCTGNLYRASVPSGPARQLTFLTDAGAVLPTFSPDGSYLAYWEVRGREYTLHLLHTETGEDQTVCRGPASPIQWLDAGTSLALTGKPYVPQEKAVVRIVDIVDGRAAVRDVSATTGELPEDMTRAARQFAERLSTLGEALDKARHAADMHELERVQAAWQETEQIFGALADEVAKGQPWEALVLSELDFAPYVARFTDESNLTVEERADRIVHSHLQGYIPALLGMYCQEHGVLPDGLEALARWATQGGQWRIDHVRGDDTETVRRWFVVPGADPDQVVTSYTLVDTESTQDRWVLQGPRLPSGRMYRAVYDVEKNVAGGLTVRARDVQAIE
ncbi:MAG: FecR domain-containing protein [Sedimentisphaerales bacterium]|nr:FecR domain-containing protein [Sedimentisphaerales bacterium]